MTRRPRRRAAALVLGALLAPGLLGALAGPAGAAPAAAGTGTAAAGDAITVAPGSIEGSVQLGHSTRVALTLTNPTGTDVPVTLAEAPATGSAGAPVAPAGATRPGAAPHTERTAVTGHRLVPGGSASARAGGSASAARAGADPDAGWQSLADYPTTIMDNAVGVYQGVVYSVAGVSEQQLTAAGAAYDTATGSWSAIADLPAQREKPAGAFVGDRFYVTGGWAPTGDTSGDTWAYDPASDTWSARAANTDPYAGAGTAVLDGKLYQVGGCVDGCGVTDVRVYDPASDTWSSAAAYPEATSWLSCGAIGGRLYCAGGLSDAGGYSAATYTYDPRTDSWARLADMPVPLWASAYTASGDTLVVSGGSNADGVTNAGYAYDAAGGSWSAIPAAPVATYRGGSVCGLYTVGGSVGQFDAVANTALLPGYGGCTADVNWLSIEPTELTVPANGTATVTVTLDAGVLDQPGTQAAAIAVTSPLADPTPAVPVTLIATPPDGWGQLVGTVSGTSCTGTTAPLSGATVEVDAADGTGTPLRTGRDGRFGYWFDAGDGPFTVVVAADGWRAQLRTVRLSAGGSTTADVTLAAYPGC